MLKSGRPSASLDTAFFSSSTSHRGGFTLQESQSIPTRAGCSRSNDYAERFVRTIKESCLNRMIRFGEKSLRRTINEFVEFYHHERTHQEIGNRIVDPIQNIGDTNGAVKYQVRLGGILRYYYRQAA
ncbi:MAG: integrase core domain-containing protein [Planctomycetota bacterium]|jgi:transposase InsO family protein